MDNNVIRALCKKFSKNNRKFTPLDLVQNCLRISKVYLACLSDVSRNGNNFSKLTRDPLKFHIGAGQLSRVLFISDNIFCDLLKHKNLQYKE